MKWLVMKELLLYCDESIKDGKYYSNFYGGALIFSDNYHMITNSLNEAKHKNNLFSEIKWTKVTESYLEKYIAVMDCFFDFISLNQIKVLKSHNHVILQCMDIVLGAMQFRLNNLHQQKLPNSYFRGKKTKAKEALYRHILQRIRAIYPHFNIGINTGIQKDAKNCWEHPYRHWKFTPKNFNYNDNLTKKKRCPVEPT